MLMLIQGWERLKSNEKGHTRKKPSSGFAIVITFRDEENNLPRLLNSLGDLSYPKDLYEIIFMNDHSTDSGSAMVSAFIKSFDGNAKLLDNPNNYPSPKKSAISFAVGTTAKEYILTTDADCEVPSTWLSELDTFLSKSESKCVSMPVRFFRKKGVLRAMLDLEFASLVGSGAAMLKLGFPTMCNGANFCFKKSSFKEVNGYLGNEKTISGDDEFLFHRIYKRFPKQVRFLKSEGVLVKTEPPKTFSQFVQQRVRWGSKWGQYELGYVKLTAVLILLKSLFLFLVPILNLTIWNSIGLWVACLSIVFFDFVYLFGLSEFFRIRFNPFIFLLTELFYILYVLFIGLISQRGNFTWKDRQYSPATQGAGLRNGKGKK